MSLSVHVFVAAIKIKKKIKNINIICLIINYFHAGNLHLYKIPSSKKGADTEEKNDYDW